MAAAAVPEQQPFLSRVFLPSLTCAATQCLCVPPLEPHIGVAGGGGGGGSSCAPLPASPATGLHRVSAACRCCLPYTHHLPFMLPSHRAPCYSCLPLPSLTSYCHCFSCHAMILLHTHTCALIYYLPAFHLPGARLLSSGDGCHSPLFMPPPLHLLLCTSPHLLPLYPPTYYLLHALSHLHTSYLPQHSLPPAMLHYHSLAWFCSSVPYSGRAGWLGQVTVWRTWRSEGRVGVAAPGWR